MAIQRVEVKNPVGVNTSINSADLPPSVWSEVLNVGFKDGRSKKAQGYTSVFGTTPVNTLYLTQQVDSGLLYWYEMTPTHIYRTTGTTHDNLSKPATTYAATEESGWTSGVLNGVVYCNNLNNVPQILRKADATFIDLPNWTATNRATLMRSYKNYMVALGVNKAGTEYPVMVKWSAPADPGQVPSTWNEADPTNDAGENNLSGTGDAIVDGMKLRDSFIIYKSGSVHSMSYVGGTFVFSFRQLFDDIGLISKEAVAEFDGKHFVVGRGDVYVHNGVQKNSVIDGKMKDYLFSSIRDDASERTFVVPDYQNTSMWICYCSSDRNTLSLKGCNKALIWNWVEDTWSIRDLPNVRYATYGIVDPKLPNTWDSDAGSWDTDTTIWGERMYNPSKMKILMTSVETDKIYVVGNTSLFDTTSFNSVLGRTGISLGDDRGIKSVTSITPHVSGDGDMKIYVGASYIQDGPISWKGPYSYTIGSQYKADFKLSGRYLAVRFEVDSGANWVLNGYTLEVAPQGGLR
jgi:hypothetical protein